MKWDVLLWIGLTVLVLPLLGTALAMALGVVVTLRPRRFAAANGRAGGAYVEVLENRLRGAAAIFGHRIENAVLTDARTTPDRRTGERRLQARRQHPRPDVDRRRRERRRQHRRASRSAALSC